MLTPAPLDVRVARVIVPPLPFAAYFLLRVPQVTVGGYVPWPEAVVITMLVAVMVPLWLYWIADLITWRREHPARTPMDQPSPLELTADLSDHGVFAGDLAALVDAEAHGRRVPPRHLLVGLDPATDDFTDSLVYAWSAFGPRRDDRPTEPLLMTHEFTPASGIALDFPDMSNWRPLPEMPPEIYVPPSPTGRHRRLPDPPLQRLPPPTDDNAEAYAFLNRSRELGF